MNLILLFFVFVKTEVAHFYKYQRSSRQLVHDNYQVQGYPDQLDTDWHFLSEDIRRSLTKLMDGIVIMYKVQFLIL